MKIREFKPNVYGRRPRDALSRAHDGHGAQVTNERLLWDIPEIFDTKDGDGVANFKKIIRV